MSRSMYLELRLFPPVAQGERIIITLPGGDQLCFIAQEVVDGGEYQRMELEIEALRGDLTLHTARMIRLAGAWSAWTDDAADHVSLLNLLTGERIQIPWRVLGQLRGH